MCSIVGQRMPQAPPRHGSAQCGWATGGGGRPHLRRTLRLPWWRGTGGLPTTRTPQDCSSRAAGGASRAGCLGTFTSLPGEKKRQQPTKLIAWYSLPFLSADLPNITSERHFHTSLEWSQNGCWWQKRWTDEIMPSLPMQQKKLI